MTLKHCKVLKCLIDFALISIISIHSYAQRSQYTVPRNVWSVCATDLDNDEHMDLITGHNYDWFTYWGGISIIENMGYGNFQIKDSLYFYGGQVILSGNLNSNPLPEIIFRKWDTAQFIGLLYDNTYSDTSFLNISSDKPASYMDLGDVDFNGYSDILFASNNGQFWGIFYNYGNRVFSSPEFHYVTDYYPLDIACGDLNGDGREDVAISGQDMEVYYSLPTGFQKTTYPDAQKSMLGILDFDGDGFKDLITGADLSLINITSMVIYRNQADTNLEALPEVYFNPGSTDFCVNDFNGDELPDVAFLSYFPYIGGGGPDTIGGIYILYNTGDFQVSDPQYVPVTNRGEAWRHFTSADLDGNGYNDFAVVKTLEGPLEGNLELLFNDGKGNFSGNPVGSGVDVTNPQTLSISAYPNPFTDKTTISLCTQKSCHVDLYVYDLHSRTIQGLVGRQLPMGDHTFQWNGCHSSGDACKPGVYLVTLKIDGRLIQTMKLIKL